MERSITKLAKGTIRNLRYNFLQGEYPQVESDDENINSLFYSEYQNGEDSLPLVLSNTYSDRSQLIFDQDEEDMELEDSNLFNYQNRYSQKPSSIYLDQSEVTGSSYDTPRLLSNSLLPNFAPTSKDIGISNNKKYKDPIFVILYIICFLLYSISGVVLLIVTKSDIMQDYMINSIFSTIKNSTGVFASLTFIAFVVGSLWILIVHKFTKIFVWGCIFIVPVGFTSIFLWTSIESFHEHIVYEGTTTLVESDKQLKVVATIYFILNLIYVVTVFSQKHKVDKVIPIIQVTYDVIKNNPGIFLLSFILLTAYILFSLIWITLFNKIWLLGHLNTHVSLRGTIWVVNNYTYWIAAFHMFIYIWTSKLLIYIERFSLSFITAQWYFYRNQQTDQSVWKTGLSKACTTSFGTIAFGSFILSLIQSLQSISRTIRRYLKSFSLFSSGLDFILGWIDSLVGAFSHHTLSLSGITEESFLSSAETATKLFRRNMISGLLGDLLIQFILYSCSVLVALVSGWTAYLYASHHLYSPHGFIVGFIGTLVPWYLSQFFSCIIISIVDASFLCYAIDLDTGRVHSLAIHNAFSNLK